MMTLWVIFAVMTGVSALAVLWPLSRPARVDATAVESGAEIYRAQIAEIEGDLARGVIRPAEAEALKVEAARRLIRADAQPVPASAGDEPTLRRRRAASAIVLTTVPLAALILYGVLGSPNLPAQPFATRVASAGQTDLQTALARIEEHLAKEPGDLRGWDVLAPLYMRLERYEDAVRAYETAIANGGANATRWAALGEARMAVAEGAVTPQVREAFEAALKLEADTPQARYGLALGKFQEGNAAEAIKDLEAMLAAAPADAPYAGLLRETIAEWRGTPKGGEAIASLPAPERDAAIKGMVEALSERLMAGGGTRAEWVRLIRARVVLGDVEAAKQALAAARARLAQDEAALAEFKALAGELKLEKAE